MTACSLRKKNISQGITLTELIAALAIIALLAAIAYPSYLNQVRKSKRAVAKSALLDIANHEEQFFFSNRAYTTQLKDDLNYLENTVCFNDEHAQVACGGGSTVYQVTAAILGCGTAPCFIISAVPQNDQVNDSCGTFTLDSSNARTAATSDCW